jgi:hypothetical protein
VTNPYLPPADSAGGAARVGFAGYRDSGWRGVLLSVLVAADAALKLLVLFFVLTRRVPELLALDPVTRLAAVLVAISWLVWLRRVLANAHAFGHEALSFRSVLRLFVPVANVVWTYQLVSEVWRASEPADASATPRSWVSNATPDLIKAWWGTFLASNVLAFFAVSDRSPSPVAFGTSVVLAVLSAACGIVMVRRLDTRQRSFAEARASGAVWQRRRARTGQRRSKGADAIAR